MRSSTSSNAGLPMYREHHHDRYGLKIDAFYLRLSRSVGEEKQFPGTLTLVYLPWMNGIEVNGSKIRGGKPVILALPQVRSTTAEESGPLFVSKVRVRTGEDGAGFQVYDGEKEVLRGVIRRGGAGGGWMTDCWSNSPGAKVWVTEERGGVKAARRSRKKRRPPFCPKLEDILEEEEIEGVKLAVDAGLLMVFLAVWELACWLFIKLLKLQLRSLRNFI